MLEFLLPILSSSGFGSIIGWAGGLLNRGVDLKAKQAEYGFQLSMRDKDMQEIKLETEKGVAIANLQIEEAGYRAMSESYHEQSNMTGTWVDAFSKFIRPFCTLVLMFSALGIATYMVYMNIEMGTVVGMDTTTMLVDNAVEWVFFQASVAIGWWFANRPAGRPTK